RGELVRIRLQTLEAKAEAVADVEPLPVDTFRALGYELIGEDDDRNLILLGDVESEHGGVEAVLDVGQREDDPRRVTVRPVERLLEVRLLGLRRNTGRGPHPLT